MIAIAVFEPLTLYLEVCTTLDLRKMGNAKPQTGDNAGSDKT